MSTTIKSALDPEEFDATIYLKTHGNIGIKIKAFGKDQPPITLSPADLIAALRTEGVLPEDDGLRERVEALSPAYVNGEWRVLLTDIKEALNPPKPFEFPTGLGAVVEVNRKNVPDAAFKLIRTGDRWNADDSFAVWSEPQILEELTDFRVLSEGVEL